MERLDKMWSACEEDIVPFRANVNEHGVHKVIAELKQSQQITSSIRSRTFQWIRWHRFVHSDDTDFESRRQILAEIETLLR